MGNILSNRKSGKSVPASSICAISSHNTDDTCSIRLGGIETHSPRLDGGKAEPTNLTTQIDGSINWEEFYKSAWKLKLRLLKEDNC